MAASLPACKFVLSARDADHCGGIPGCIKDLITRNVVKLKNICFAVIDEADEMLDYGFLPDIRHVLSEDGRNCRLSPI